MKYVARPKILKDMGISKGTLEKICSLAGAKKKIIGRLGYYDIDLINSYIDAQDDTAREHMGQNLEQMWEARLDKEKKRKSKA